MDVRFSTKPAVATITRGFHPGAISQPAPFVDVFGLRVENTDLRSATERIVDAAVSETPLSVGFVNAHLINLLNDGDVSHDTLKEFDVFFGDGIGVALAARLNGTKLVDNVNGTDMFDVLCERATEARQPMFFFGGKPGIAEVAAKKAEAEFGIQVVGTCHGYKKSKDEDIINEINASGAKILLVAMGMPIQEEWIAKHRSSLKPIVIIAVGGLFDFVSGQISRAPKAVRKLHMEWMWRLANEPRRLFARYVIGGPRFLFDVVRMRAKLAQHNAH